MANHDADLHFWSEIREWGVLQIRGVIMGDSKGRFPDGTIVRTSEVSKCEGDTLYTKNSTYRLVPEAESIAALKAGVASTVTTRERETPDNG